MSNLFGSGKVTSGGGGRGPRGATGIGISTIDMVDNNDGSVDLSFNMSNSTTLGPYTATLTSDNLLALNKISVTGTNATDKFVIAKADSSTLLACDTTNAVVSAKDQDGNELLGVYKDFSIVRISGKNKGAKFTVLNEAGTALFTCDTVTPQVSVATTLQMAAGTNLYAANLGVSSAMTLSSLTPNRLLQLNGSSVVTASNTLPSGAIIPSPTTTGQVLSANGTSGAPAYSFTNATTTGLYITTAGAPAMNFMANGQTAFSCTQDGLFTSKDIMPGGDGVSYLGFTGTKWAGVYTVALTATGNVTTSGVNLAAAGSAGAPTYSFSTYPTTGMYMSASNELSFSIGGGRRVNMTTTAINLACALVQTTSITTQSALRYDADNAGTLPMKVYNASVQYNTSTKVGIQFHTGTSTTNSANYIYADGTGRFILSPQGLAVVPGTDNTCTLGDSGSRWSTVYAGTGTINTSDANQKNTIENAPLGLAFIEQLTPRRFKFNDGTSGRFHYGFVAQEVKAVMDANTIAAQDFAGYIETTYDVETVNVDETVTTTSETRYGLRYTEFIAPMVKAMQELNARCDALQAQLDAVIGA